MTLAPRYFTNALVMGLVTTTGITISSAPTLAANLSFTGNLANPNDTRSALFSLTAPATVTIRSYSWGGGTNAEGTVIPSGGFDPIVTLFNDNNGNFITEQEDIGPSLDFQLIRPLPAGNYRAVISAFANFANGSNFSNGFGGGGDFFGRTSAYAFDINTDSATSTAIPEPSSLIGTAIAGFAAVSLKRKLASSKKTNR